MTTDKPEKAEEMWAVTEGDRSYLTFKRPGSLLGRELPEQLPVDLSEANALDATDPEFTRELENAFWDTLRGCNLGLDVDALRGSKRVVVRSDGKIMELVVDDFSTVQLLNWDGSTAQLEGFVKSRALDICDLIKEDRAVDGYSAWDA